MSKIDGHNNTFDLFPIHDGMYRLFGYSSDLRTDSPITLVSDKFICRMPKYVTEAIIDGTTIYVKPSLDEGKLINLDIQLYLHKPPHFKHFIYDVESKNLICTTNDSTVFADEDIPRESFRSDKRHKEVKTKKEKHSPQKEKHNPVRRADDTPRIDRQNNTNDNANVDDNKNNNANNTNNNANIDDNNADDTNNRNVMIGELHDWQRNQLIENDNSENKITVKCNCTCCNTPEFQEDNYDYNNSEIFVMPTELPYRGCCMRGGGTKFCRTNANANRTNTNAGRPNNDNTGTPNNTIDVPAQNAIMINQPEPSDDVMTRYVAPVVRMAPMMFANSDEKGNVILEETKTFDQPPKSTSQLKINNQFKLDTSKCVPCNVDNSKQLDNSKELDSSKELDPLYMSEEEFRKLKPYGAKKIDDDFKSNTKNSSNQPDPNCDLM